MAQRFKFRLATVLRVRRTELQTRQRAVAVRLGRIRDLKQRAVRVQRQIEMQIGAARSTLQAGMLSLEQVLWDRQQLARLRRELMETNLATEQEQLKLVEEQGELAEAMKRVRALERYEEKLRDAHVREERRVERIVEDEANVQRYAIGMDG